MKLVQPKTETVGRVDGILPDLWRVLKPFLFFEDLEKSAAYNILDELYRMPRGLDGVL